MPKPFPFPLNIGTDICSIARIQKIFRKPSRGPQFVRRILTERECQESRSRWEAPIERYWQAWRRRLLLEWKRDQLGLSKNWTRTQILSIREKRGWLDDAENAQLLYYIERDEKTEVVDDEVELELDGGNDLPEIEASEDTESSSFTNTKVVAKKIPNEDAKKGKLSDKEAMLLLMERNMKEIREAEVGLNLAAQFIAGRFAAKEAVIKAHHNRRLTYHSIIIHLGSSKQLEASDRVQGSKAPYAVVISESGSWEDGQEVKLSISHDGGYATAVCLAYETNPSEPTKVSTQDGRKPVIYQASFSTREAAMLLEDDEHHGDRQVQLIQQEMERRQTLNDTDSSSITQGDTVRHVEDTPKAYETVEKKIPNQIEMSRRWTTAQRRASIRGNGAAIDFWNLVSQMSASQKLVLLKTRSRWRPFLVLMIDGLPDGTSSNRWKALLRDVDKSSRLPNVMLANDTEGKSLGFAFVKFKTATSAKLALSKASLFVLDEKPLVCRWMGENRDVGVSEKPVKGSIEAQTPRSQNPIEESDFKRTNVDIEADATDEIDENTGAQQTPAKTPTMTQRRRIKRKTGKL